MQVKEEYVGLEVLDHEILENFQILDVVKVEDIDKIEVRKARKQTRKARENNPEEHEKIMQFAVMSCDLCEAPFDSVDQVLIHYRKVHKTEGYFKCCDKQFKKRSKLLDHINFVHFSVTYNCDICGKAYGCELYLRRHKMYHEEEQNYVRD